MAIGIVPFLENFLRRATAFRWLPRTPTFVEWEDLEAKVPNGGQHASHALLPSTSALLGPVKREVDPPAVHCVVERAASAPWDISVKVFVPKTADLRSDWVIHAVAVVTVVPVAVASLVVAVLDVA